MRNNQKQIIITTDNTAFPGNVEYVADGTFPQIRSNESPFVLTLITYQEISAIVTSFDFQSVVKRIAQLSERTFEDLDKTEYAIGFTNDKCCLCTVTNYTFKFWRFCQLHFDARENIMGI